MIISRLVGIFVLLSLLGVNSAIAGDNDKALLTKKGYIGGFSKSNGKKVTGKITLELYKPYVDKITSTGLPDINKTKKLTVEYDEVWERKNTEYLSKAEIKKCYNNLDTVIVYLNKNKIMAFVEKKKLTGNPLTGQKFSAPEYKITSLQTREEVMRNYR